MRSCIRIVIVILLLESWVPFINTSEREMCIKKGNIRFTLYLLTYPQQISINKSGIIALKYQDMQGIIIYLTLMYAVLTTFNILKAISLGWHEFNIFESYSVYLVASLFM